MSFLTQRIDFYLLPYTETIQVFQFTCRLIEKAFRTFQHQWIYVENNDQAEILHQLLWSFDATSFIPHTLIKDEKASSMYPVKIIHKIVPSTPPPPFMISLTNHVEKTLNKFQRMAYILPDFKNKRDQARKNFSFYQKKKMTPNIHHIS